MVKQKRSDEAEKVLRVIILRLEKLLNARPVSSAGVTQASVTTEKVLGRKEDRLCCDGTIVVGKLLKVFSCVPMSIPRLLVKNISMTRVRRVSTYAVLSTLAPATISTTKNRVFGRNHKIGTRSICTREFPW